MNTCFILGALAGASLVFIITMILWSISILAVGRFHSDAEDKDAGVFSRKQAD